MTLQASEKWRGPPPYDYHQRTPYPVRRGPPPPHYSHRAPHYTSGPPPLRGGPPPLPQHPAASHRHHADYWYPYDSTTRGPPREHVPPPYAWSPPHPQSSSYPRPTVSASRDQYARGPPPQYHQHDPYRAVRNEKQESSSQRSSPMEESWTSKGKASEARDRPDESSSSKESNVNGPKQGDPLSLLAKVSSTMAPPKSRQTKKEAPEVSKAPPTSPMSSKKRTSPVNTPGPSRRSENPTLITPTVSYGPYEAGDARPPPYYPYGGSLYPSYHGPPPPYYRDWVGEYPPAVVERNSFDSGESMDGRPRIPHNYYPSPRSRSSRGRAPPETPDLRWSYSPEYGPPPPPHYLPPRPTPDGRAYPGEFGPYTYVQHPTVEEKIILRKKFSWKHYPELERFLIEHRDEYLNHSSRNYTVEQKQFNNMLTEELIKLAARHNYAFDPQDFNFVAIRDRIRCYYKSYVQTARKRGLMLPSTSVSKKGKKTEREGNDELSEGEGSTAKDIVTNE